ncbi:HTH-type transcriptional regulator YidZ [Ferrimonas sp. YFM]|uniref:HTH-type transcriptional regulator YidZ n=1 Tax=Ferrimonas sp. YFM TaxID=3028878 RepID=UPI0025722BF1|nr:HTH-type transcriptional regulator YidZ [Ferrimonas sp. YFM]BDY04454.1 DNA-binding transcriptional regulator [Ferrimonas sp. YFM]
MTPPLNRLDLNLLITLKLLLQERSVSKAAKRLSVTPSAVSKSLNKLRDWFDDPLFTNGPSGLCPTPLAMAMEEELVNWMALTSQLAERRSDETPKGMQFRLMIESPLSTLALQQLPSQILESYPDSSAKLLDWNSDSLEAIVSGEVDLGLSGREVYIRSKESINTLPYYVDHQVLFDEPPLVFLHQDHPALKQNWDLETFLSFPHINVTWEGRDLWALDDKLAEMGLSRNISLWLSQFTQSLLMAEGSTQLMATAPAYCRAYASRFHPELTWRPIPLPQEPLSELSVPLTLIWHKRNNHNPKLLWLRQQVCQLVQLWYTDCSQRFDGK